MKILYICHRIPYPPNKGEKIRAFNEIKLLGKEHEIHLTFLIDDSRDLGHIEGLRAYCASCTYDTINPALKKFGSLINLPSRRALSLSFFYSAKLQEDIDNLLEKNEFGAIICYSSPMAEYVFRSRVLKKMRRKPKLIMDFVDVDSDKWRMYSKFTRFPFNWIYRREARFLQDYEKYVGETFDVSVLVSPKERELFSSFCPNAEAVSMANGVDLDFFRAGDRKPDQAESKDSLVLMFMGAMNYFPNEDAVVYFAREIFPLVRRRYPKAEFLIVGSRPTKKVKRLAEQDPAITVTGYVPDVRDYLRKSDIFVAPLRIARGLQNKVLEALAAGLPVVASPQALQGLSCGTPYVKKAETPARFFECIRELAESRDRDQHMSSIREFFLDHYTWEKNLSAMQQMLG